MLMSLKGNVFLEPAGQLKSAHTHCKMTFKDLAFFNPSDTPSITAKLINEQKEDKEKKNHEEKEKMKADNGFQDNYSVVVASGTV